MIDHISIAVSDLAASTAFYEKVFEPLGLVRIAERNGPVGFGKRYPEFWLNARPDMATIPDNVGNHVCLRAPSMEAVTAFYETAIQLGGRCDGAPDHRQATMTTYFGAFILDLDGNKIEAAAFPRSDS